VLGAIIQKASKAQFWSGPHQRASLSILQSLEMSKLTVVSIMNTPALFIILLTWIRLIKSVVDIEYFPSFIFTYHLLQIFRNISFLALSQSLNHSTSLLIISIIILT
jgi:hypothetical protein